MAYASGGLITASDYNSLSWGGTQGTYTASPVNLAYVLGVGYGQFGYGQSAPTAARAAVLSSTQ